METKRTIDNITNRGFIHNTYFDAYGNKYRIAQSSGVDGGVWIFGPEKGKDENFSLLLKPRDIKKFCKELKRIGKGKVRTEIKWK